MVADCQLEWGCVAPTSLSPEGYQMYHRPLNWLQRLDEAGVPPQHGRKKKAHAGLHARWGGGGEFEADVKESTGGLIQG